MKMYGNRLSRLVRLVFSVENAVKHVMYCTLGQKRTVQVGLDNPK